MKRVSLLLLLLLYYPLVRGEGIDRQQPVSLNFQQAPVSMVLQALADYQQLNLVTDEQISGHLTLRLEQVPWQKALQVVLRLKRLQAVEQDNILLITPEILQETLLREQEARLREQEERQQRKEQQAALVRYSYKVRHAQPEYLAELLRPQLSPRGSLLVDAMNHTLVIRESALLMDELQQTLVELDQSPPQVKIAAHIVNISQESLDQLGVRWGLASPGEGGSTPRIGEFNVDLPVPAPTSRAGLQFARLNGRLLDMELSALEHENQLEIIASPRLLTVTQNKASIKQGSELPYEVSSGASGATSVEFKEAVLGMEVTPRVMGDGRIELSLLISQNMPGRALKRKEGETLTIDKQEIQTLVTVADGETLALGGIFQQSKQKNDDQVPGLGDIPLLGALFQRQSQEHSRRELVIFITPNIAAPI